MDNTTLIVVAAINVVPALVTLAIAVMAKMQINVLEKNTNSIKDALVASTAENSEAKGVLLGRAQMTSEQAVVPDTRTIQKETVVERVVKKEK